ncbi:type IV secretion system protein VirB10 [Brevundimonas nasdae]|uniref:Type IV secretion system protein VirB10 n=1 Tax=Brevundimonas nasdae TaxID=172043 RepID=A0ABX8TJR4_9CAUL|nr:type IV secretion system protein VirB10 [Brevundimonas nasdae]QYC11461.1 type IV secretion system protein VirB10 [Brevundimonas nasdae]QYC14249.1 type IV secretion system protein VirB10 [Brevundimonas nasdae]
MTLDPAAGESANEADTVGHDRGISPIGGRFGAKRAKLVTIVGLAVGCGAFLAATWDRGAAPTKDDQETPPRQLAAFEPASPRPALADVAIDPDAPPLSEGEDIPAIEAGPAPPPSASSARGDSLQDSARRAPVLAYSRRSSDVDDAFMQSELAAEPVTALNAEPTALDQLRRQGAINQARAGRLPDRNLIITAGAVLPCVLQTALDSSTPGYAACVLSRDVYSESGAVVLMERGTRVLGEYRGGVQQGQARLFVLWTRAVTPTGVTVALASPAADALGRAGLDGEIDRHFWDRFGGAILLSLIDESAAVLSESGAGRTTIRLPSDVASTALAGTINIAPTLRRAQGAEVSIFVAQDLDFRSVYRLRAR